MEKAYSLQYRSGPWFHIKMSSYQYSIGNLIVFCNSSDLFNNWHIEAHTMAHIWLVTFWYALSWMKMLQFRLKFHWISFFGIRFTVSQHWLRWWLCAEQATSHYLNQWWLNYVTHICVARPHWVNINLHYLQQNECDWTMICCLSSAFKQRCKDFKQQQSGFRSKAALYLVLLDWRTDCSNNSYGLF